MAAETIFALASGGPPAGVAVIRVSGPAAGDVARALTGEPALPEPRRATRAVFHTRDGEALDDGLVLWFPRPHSYTGEDVAEFHLHGGRAVIDGMLEALGGVEDCRLAEPGEFTRRAFENGKLDLAQAEAVGDLVMAETDAQRVQALRQMEGELSRVYEDWRARLVGLLAHLEASIDFSDEDLPETVVDRALAGVDPLIEDLGRHLDDARRGEILRGGLSVVIVGAPNAGKSLLLNQLARRDAAIVSSRAGTTRDTIDVHLSVGGYPVILTDTAGLRELDPADPGADEIEAEGIRRAMERAGRADLTLAVFDATLAPDKATLAGIDDRTIAVANKMDLVGEVEGKMAPHLAPLLAAIPDAVPVSARTGAGLGDLIARLGEAARARFAGGASVITRARHREAVTKALEHLRHARAGGLPELVAEDIRLAARALGRVTGRVDVEDLLDVIFRDFCIGK